MYKNKIFLGEVLIVIILEFEKIYINYEDIIKYNYVEKLENFIRI